MKMSIFIKKRTLVMILLVSLLLTALCQHMNYFQWPATGRMPGGKDRGEGNKVPVAGEVYFTRGEIKDGISYINKKEGTADFFVEYRLERECTRGRQVELLREVINNSSSGEETRRKAQEQLMDISRVMGKEVELENLIRAKGVKDAAVLLDNRAVMVIVADSGAVSSEVYQLTDLASRGAGLAREDVVVVLKK